MHRDRARALSRAALRIRVEEGVRRHVVHLSRRRDGRRGRRVEEHEVALGIFPEELVEDERAVDLRREHLSDRGQVLHLDQLVANGSGGVHHATDRAKFGACLLDQAAHLLEVGHVRCGHPHLRAHAFELSDAGDLSARRVGFPFALQVCVPGVSRGQAAAREKDQIAARSRKLARRHQPEAAEAAGDQVGAAWPQDRRCLLNG